MRLTYTSGDMTQASREFDAALARARGTAADPLPHLIGGEDVHEGEVVADLPLGHSLTRDELFLPFVTVTKVHSFEEALAEPTPCPTG